jgi:hypothetical protein
MTTQQLRLNGFHIYPIGRKVCFVDTRNGYTSPSYDPDTCQEKLAEYMGAHRVAPTVRNERVLPL